MLEVTKLRVKDRLRYSRTSQALVALARLWRGSLTSDEGRRLERWADAYRVCCGIGKPEWAAAKLRPYVEDPVRATIWRDRHLGHYIYPSEGKHAVLSRGLVLKPPLPNGERGVMLLSFESNVLNIMACREFPEIARRYTLLVFTSWFPPAYPMLWQLAHYPESDVYISISYAADRDEVQYLNSGARVLPFYMSDFINPDWVAPKPRDQREIDIIMVANWAPFKRHWRLFETLARLGRKLNVVLVGQPDSGRTVADVERQAELFGVRDLVTFHNRLTVPEVTKLQANSKVSVILSKREGSCVVNAEAVFADTPIGLVRGAQVGSAAYVNEQTGVFLDDATLAEDLGRFLDRHLEFRPREWAVANISNRVNQAKLTDILKRDAAATGRPWTQDLCGLSWWGHPTYTSDAERDSLVPLYRHLRDAHGLTFKAVLLDP